MFGKIGIWQIVLVFAVFVVLFGYKKMPELGKTLGQGIRNFRRALAEKDEIDITPEPKKETTPPEEKK